MSEWQQIGQVPIDMGLMALVDPMNADDVTDHLEQLVEMGSYGVVTNEEVGIPVAVVASTGLGDGVYPVEARFEDVPGWGTRLAEVRIRFLPHPVLGYELPPGGEA